jgi:Protein of unknown function (DUF1353)
MSVSFSNPVFSLSSDGRTFVFKEKWDVIFDDCVITVSRGFRSDLTSTPWFLRWFLPVTGSHVFAALIHDYIIKTENDWKKANHYTKIMLHSRKVPVLRKYGMILGIGFWRIFK